MTGRRQSPSKALAVSLAGLALVVAVVVGTVPLRAVLAPLLPATGVVGATDARGTPWRGTLRSAVVAGSPVGDVDVRLQVLPLLLGRAVVALRGDALEARLLRGARVGIAEATGSVDLPAPAEWPGTRTTLSLDDASLVFAGGECRMGAGTVALSVLLPDPALPPLRLAGPLGCIAGHGRATLQADSGGVGAVLDIAGDGRWRLQATAPAADSGLRIALQLAGFRDAGGALQREWRGQLGVAGAGRIASPR